MTTFEDFTSYTYYRTSTPMINIGWLGAKYPFPTGSVDAAFVEKLTRHAEHPFTTMRGWHVCRFCGDPSRRPREPIFAPAPYLPAGEVFLGNGEIHVVGKSGETYSAPTLIIHYITAHAYCPPQVFLDAAMETAVSGPRFPRPNIGAVKEVEAGS